MQTFDWEVNFVDLIPHAFVWINHFLRSTLNITIPGKTEKKNYAYGKLNHQSQAAVWHVMFDFYPIQSKFDRCRMPDDRFESKWFYGYLLSKKLKTVLLYRVKKILRLFSH